MITDMTVPNTLAWMDYEFERNPVKMIYIGCEKCDYDRFEIRDSIQTQGPSGTVYSLLIAQCLQCGATYDISIQKVPVR